VDLEKGLEEWEGSRIKVEAGCVRYGRVAGGVVERGGRGANRASLIAINTAT
jgi:hypothetical protein